MAGSRWRTAIIPLCLLAISLAAFGLYSISCDGDCGQASGASVAHAPSSAQRAVPRGQFAELNRDDLTPKLPAGFNYTPPVDLSARQFTLNGAKRVWYGQGPGAGDTARPTIILFHGAQRDGRSMLDMWKDVGQSEMLVLIAPDSTSTASWDGSREGPNFLDRLIEEATKFHAVDKSRLYLFGHSAGANHALELVASGQRSWRGVGVHAGALAAARRSNTAVPVPVFIYVGDKDHVFSVQASRTTAQSLSSIGHPVELNVIPNHTHWFYVIGPDLARDAWKKMAEF